MIIEDLYTKTPNTKHIWINSNKNLVESGQLRTVKNIRRGFWNFIEYSYVDYIPVEMATSCQLNSLHNFDLMMKKIKEQNYEYFNDPTN